MDPEKDFFKVCVCCGQKWFNREEFLNDANLVLNGYQAIFEDLDQGLFFFTHNVADCASTLALEAYHFLDLNKKMRPLERKTNTEVCPQFCLKTEELKMCPVDCECAHIRDLIQIIQEYKNKHKISSEENT